MTDNIYEQIGRRAVEILSTAQFAIQPPGSEKTLKKKACKKGLSCNFTCIAADKVCRVSMTMEQQKAAAEVRKAARAGKKAANQKPSPDLPTLEDLPELDPDAAIDRPIGVKQDHPAKFLETAAEARPETVAAIKEGGKNVQPIFLSSDDEILAGGDIAAAAKKAGVDFVSIIEVPKDGRAQLKLEQSMPTKVRPERGEEYPKPLPGYDDPHGQVIRKPVKFLDGDMPGGKDIDALADSIKKSGKNIQPIYVAPEDEDGNHRIVGNAHIAAAMRKAGLDFAQVIVLNKAMQAQLATEVMEQQKTAARAGKKAAPAALDKEIAKRDD